MRTRIIFLTLISLFLSSSVFAKSIQLGDPLSLSEITKVSEINEHPEKYIGKKVQIEGLIIDVCAGRGCWMDIASDVPFEKIQVKVVDGEIVFPLDAKGKNARVEGLVEKLTLTQEQAEWMAQHRAEERGEAYDPGSVKGPVTFYRIRGLGAVID